MAGLAPAHALSLLSFSLPPEVRQAFVKKGAYAPVLTRAQARRLVVAALAMSCLPKRAALELLAYHLRRNHVSWRSHRKRTLADTPMDSS